MPICIKSAAEVQRGRRNIAKTNHGIMKELIIGSQCSSACGGRNFRGSGVHGDRLKLSEYFQMMKCAPLEDVKVDCQGGRAILWCALG